MKVAEAAKILGVCQGTVRAWAEAGKIPMHKNPINGYRLFLMTDLGSFLDLCALPVENQNQLSADSKRSPNRAK